MKKGDLVQFEGAMGLIKSIEILLVIIDDKHEDFRQGEEVTVCEEDVKYTTNVDQDSLKRSKR